MNDPQRQKTFLSFQYGIEKKADPDEEEEDEDDEGFGSSKSKEDEDPVMRKDPFLFIHLENQ